MRISAHWSLSPNFGDALTPWLIQKITGRDAVYVGHDCQHQHFVLSGSILNWANHKAYVWGAGLGSLTDGVNCDARIFAVRGPLSRLRAISFGANAPAVYGDPALVLPKLYDPPAKKRFKLGIVPHYVDMYKVYELYKGEPEINVIDICSGIENVINEVVACEHIVSSALHGLIVADAYGVPSRWAKFTDSICGDGTKYWDHLLTVGKATLEARPQWIECRYEDRWSMAKWLDREWLAATVDAGPLWGVCPLRNMQ